VSTGQAGLSLGPRPNARGIEGQRDITDGTDDGMENDECPSTFDTSTKRGLEAGAGIDSITLRAQ